MNELEYREIVALALKATDGLRNEPELRHVAFRLVLEDMLDSYDEEAPCAKP